MFLSMYKYFVGTRNAAIYDSLVFLLLAELLPPQLARASYTLIKSHYDLVLFIQFPSHNPSLLTNSNGIAGEGEWVGITISKYWPNGRFVVSVVRRLACSKVRWFLPINLHHCIAKVPASMMALDLFTPFSFKVAPSVEENNTISVPK